MMACMFCRQDNRMKFGDLGTDGSGLLLRGKKVASSLGADNAFFPWMSCNDE